MGESQLFCRIARPVQVTERTTTLDAQMDRAELNFGQRLIDSCHPIGRSRDWPIRQRQWKFWFGPVVQPTPFPVFGSVHQPRLKGIAFDWSGMSSSVSIGSGIC